MRDPVTITLRGIASTQELESCISKEVDRLDASQKALLGCAVVAEQLEGDARTGKRYAARVIVTLPGAEVVVNREHNEDIVQAMRSAFAAVEQQLRAQAQRKPGQADPS